MDVPGTYNITIYRGDDWKKSLTIDIDGVVVDLTCCDILAQIRPSANSSIIFATIAVENRDDTAGTFDLVLSHTETGDTDTNKLGNPNVTTGIWDLQITSAGGLVDTWLRGTVTITADVSEV